MKILSSTQNLKLDTLLHLSIHPERLINCREKLGISQRELARLCGISQAQISKYESGGQDATGANLRALSQGLGVTSDYLLGLSDTPYPTTTDPLSLTREEFDLVSIYRHEGWMGLLKMGLEHVKPK